MEDVLKLLTPLFDGPSGGGGSFTVVIPKSHPRAKEIAYLVQKLATKIVMESGLEVAYQPVDADRRVELFTEVVREICEESGVDFSRLYEEALGPRQPSLVQALPQVMQGFLAAGLLSKIQPDKREELANFVEATVRRGGG